MTDTESGHAFRDAAAKKAEDVGISTAKETRYAYHPDGTGRRIDLELYKGFFGGKPELLPVAISVKYQEVEGSVDKKIPDEILSLNELMRAEFYRRAILLLGGPALEHNPKVGYWRNLCDNGVSIMFTTDYEAFLRAVK